MNRNQLYAFLFLVLPVAYWLSTPITLIDLTFWLHYGRLLWDPQQAGLVLGDGISFVSSGPAVFPYGIVSLYRLAETLGGLTWVAALHPIALGLLLVSWLQKIKSKKFSAEPSLIFVCIFALLGMASSWVERPALFGFVLAALTYQQIITGRSQPGPKQSLWLGIIYITWLLTHASFPLFWVLVGWEFVWKRLDRKTLTVLAILFFVSVSIPHFRTLWSESFRILSFATGGPIDEWAFWSGSKYGYQSLLFLGLVLTVLFWSRKNLKNLIEDPIAPLLLIGFFGVRHSFWAFWILIPWFLESKPPLPIKNQGPKFMNLVIAALALALLVFSLPPMKLRFQSYWPAEKQTLVQFQLPQSLAESLEKSKQEKGQSFRLFNEVNWGAGLILHELLPIYMDSRDHLYSQQVRDDYQEIMSGHPFALDTLAKHQVTDVLVHKSRRALISAFELTSAWRLVQEEGQLLHFQKVPGT